MIYVQHNGWHGIRLQIETIFPSIFSGSRMPKLYTEGDKAKFSKWTLKVLVWMFANANVKLAFPVDPWGLLTPWHSASPLPLRIEFLNWLYLIGSQSNMGPWKYMVYWTQANQTFWKQTEKCLYPLYKPFINDCHCLLCLRSTHDARHSYCTFPSICLTFQSKSDQLTGPSSSQNCVPLLVKALHQYTAYI